MPDWPIPPKANDPFRISTPFPTLTAPPAPSEESPGGWW